MADNGEVQHSGVAIFYVNWAAFTMLGLGSRNLQLALLRERRIDGERDGWVAALKPRGASGTGTATEIGGHAKRKDSP